MSEFPVSPEHSTRPYDAMSIISALPDHLQIADALALDKLVPGDAEAILGLVERNPDIPKHVAFAKDIKALDDVLPSLQSRSNETMDGRYAIRAGGMLVGSVWAFPGDRDGEFGVGYCLDQAARGNGYVTRAVLAILQQLEARGANEVYFQIITENKASVAIPRSLGCEPAETLIGVDFPVEQQRWRLTRPSTLPPAAEAGTRRGRLI